MSVRWLCDNIYIICIIIVFICFVFFLSFFSYCKSTSRRDLWTNLWSCGFVGWKGSVVREWRHCVQLHLLLQALCSVRHCVYILQVLPVLIGCWFNEPALQTENAWTHTNLYIYTYSLAHIHITYTYSHIVTDKSHKGTDRKKKREVVTNTEISPWRSWKPS